MNYLFTFCLDLLIVVFQTYMLPVGSCRELSETNHTRSTLIIFSRHKCQYQYPQIANICQHIGRALKCIAKRHRRVIPVLLIKLQHHVVCGDAERPPALVVLLAIHLLHIWRRHRAVVGVVVGVDGAAVVSCDIELDL